jgi:hypothetical protein
MTFSRLLGKSLTIVTGMTPSTSKVGFVSAVLNAGFHVELVGGGLYNAPAPRTKVTKIKFHREFTFQLPIWQKMRKEGQDIICFELCLTCQEGSTTPVLLADGNLLVIFSQNLLGSSNHRRIVFLCFRRQNRVGPLPGAGNGFGIHHGLVARSSVLGNPLDPERLVGDSLHLHSFH